MTKILAFLLATALASGALPSFATTLTPVPYFGGPVISHAKVYLVFWGAGVAPETQKDLASFYQAIVNSTFMDQLAEYSTNRPAIGGRPGTNQKIGRGSFEGLLTITPSRASKILAQTDLDKELEFQFTTGALPKPDADTLYMFYFPEGYDITISYGQSCKDWFAVHEAYISKKFGNAYFAMMPCSSWNSDSFDQLTTGSSHELAEAVTDPLGPAKGQASEYPAAWITTDTNEIGDLCAWRGTTLTTGSSVFSVQEIWLNSLGDCSTAAFSN